MFSFFKRKKDKQEVPKWASFFNESQYDAFLDAINNYFYAKNVTYVIGDGVLEAGPNDFGFGQLGSVNVAQVCKLDERDYKDVVREHFESMARATQFDKELRTIIDDYEKIKEYLGVAFIQQIMQQLWARN